MIIFACVCINTCNVGKALSILKCALMTAWARLRPNQREYSVSGSQCCQTRTSIGESEWVGEYPMLGCRMGDGGSGGGVRLLWVATHNYQHNKWRPNMLTTTAFDICRRACENN